MIYNDRWCVLHIPRTAGTNFKANAIMRYNNLMKLPHSSSTVESRLSQHNPLSSFSNLLDGQIVYAIVRHPYVRALSLYTYALNDPIMSKMLGPISFEDFFMGVDLSHYCEWSPRTTQCEFIEHSDIEVETFRMEDSMSKLYAATQVLHYKRYINKSVGDYTRYDTLKNKQLIEEIFSIDYERFGY